PLLVLLLALSSTPAAEISFLKGDAIKGDIVSVSDKEVVFKQGDKVQKRPLAEVLKIDYRDVGKPPSDKPFAQAELTDGTQVMLSKWLLRKKELELTLLAGPVVKLPAGAVANVLNNAQAEQTRREWKTRSFNTRGKEALVVNNAGTITNLDCTLGE